jgi:hypothetical protein
MPPPQDSNPRQDPEPYPPTQLYPSQDPQYEPVTHSGSQRQADSPARKSLFEFITPFDALASTPTSSQVKKKPVPNLIAPGPQADEQWSSIPDPKRKSVENLMEQLSRGQGSSFQPVQAMQDHSGPYQSYIPADDPYQAEHKGYSRPLPPQPQTANQISSPRSSPPKPQPPPVAQRHQRRSNESPVGQFISPQNQRDKESSPVPRGSWKGYERGRVGGKVKSPQYVPMFVENIIPSHEKTRAQLQTIIFDVSQPLDEIQAPRDAVKSTAIALVKVDSTFLPGTTIGATHWVAYAMTKGCFL